MDNENISFFFRARPIEILMELKNNGRIITASEITHRTRGTYSHVLKIINRLEEMRILIKKKEGRNVILTLTQKGREITEYLSEVIKRL